MDVDQSSENISVAETNVHEPNDLFGCDEASMILKDFLLNQDFDELKSSITVKEKELLLMVLQYSIVYGLSQTALSHLL